MMLGLHATRLLSALLSSDRFTAVSRRMFALLLLLANLVAPIGWHRVWLRWSGWWIWPAAFSLAAVGLLGHLFLDFPACARFLSVPFALLFVGDALRIVTEICDEVVEERIT